MPNASELNVIDAVGVAQVINTLPPLGRAAPAASLPVVEAPCGTVTTTPAAASFVQGHVGAGSLCAVDAVGTGWLLLFDAATDPADGAVTPLKAYPVTDFLRVEFAAPLPFVTGLVAVFSSTGPFEKTAADAFLSTEIA